MNKNVITFFLNNGGKEEIMHMPTACQTDIVSFTYKIRPLVALLTHGSAFTLGCSAVFVYGCYTM